jgi:hypothetical protein
LICASCSGSSGSGGGGGVGAGGNAGSGGVSGSGGLAGSGGIGASAGSSGSAGSAGAAGTGGTLSGTWTVIDNPNLYDTKALAGHPSDPKRMALLTQTFGAQPGAANNVSILISEDSGNTFTTTQVMEVPESSYFDAQGFVWNPDDDQQLAAAFNFPYGFEWKDLWRLVRSTDGGSSFSTTSMPQLGLLKWVAGDPGVLVVSDQNGLRTSSDFGATFAPAPSASGGCGGVLDYTQSDGHDLFACGANGVERCQGGVCQSATLPAGIGQVFELDRVPADPLRVVGLGGSSPAVFALLSTDGGQTFAKVQELGQGYWQLHMDPRAAGSAIAVHDRSGYGIWYSGDAGSSFSELTPPQSLPNTRGLATYAYELAVTADGGLVAYTAPGLLRWQP